MAKSIMQSEKKCYRCGAKTNLECHHVYHGTANRKVSEKHGFKVWLCNHCHTGGRCSVHQCSEVDRLLKQKCQLVYEYNHSHDEFMTLIGRNYI